MYFKLVFQVHGIEVGVSLVPDGQASAQQYKVSLSALRE
jgi:hypothetical protein